MALEPAQTRCVFFHVICLLFTSKMGVVMSVCGTGGMGKWNCVHKKMGKGLAKGIVGP